MKITINNAEMTWKILCETTRLSLLMEYLDKYKVKPEEIIFETWAPKEHALNLTIKFKACTFIIGKDLENINFEITDQNTKAFIFKSFLFENCIEYIQKELISKCAKEIINTKTTCIINYGIYEIYNLNNKE